MKLLSTAIIALSLTASVTTANAQFAAARQPTNPGPTNEPNYECVADHINPGRRAEVAQVLSISNAKVQRFNACQSPLVDIYFGNSEFPNAVFKNKKLKKYLATQGVAPEDVAGVQIRLGKLIVYAKNG